MKKLLLSLGGALLLLGSAKSQYCIPTYSTGTIYGDYIGMVQLGSINSTTTGAPSPFYTVDSSMSTTVSTGVSYTITLSAGSYGTNDIAAWIDFNLDGIFDNATEKLGETDNLGAYPATTSYTFTVPSGATLGTTYLRVREVYAGFPGIDPCASATYGETEDYLVNIVMGTACTGTPVAGTAAASAPGACVGVPFTLSLSGYSSGVTGIEIQWQESTDGLSFTNIPGATSDNYTTMLSDTMYYQAVVTCTASGSSAVSNMVTVNQNPFYQCYCNDSYSTNIWDTKIDSVEVDGIITGSDPTTCESYTDYTSVTGIDLQILGVNSIRVRNGSCSGYHYPAYVSVYIDYNQDGDYLEADEQVATFGPTTALNTIPVMDVLPPLTATPGMTGMRIVFSEGSSAPLPCGTYSYGETEDYVVNLVPAPPCSGTPDAGAAVTSATNICSGESATLSISGSTVASDLNYQWLESADGVTYSPISGATTFSYTVMPTDTMYYQVVVTCPSGGAADTSDAVTVYYNPFYMCYCSDNLYDYEYPCINNVTVNTLNNSSTGCSMPSWTYFPPVGSATTDLEQLVNYPVSVTDDGDAIVSMWIDYDHSGTFDATEWTQITTQSDYGVASSTLLNIPNTALTGLTGMRIRTTYYWNANGATDACTYFYGGETEDYVVNILPAPPCVNTPVGGTISGPAADSIGNTVTYAVTGGNGDEFLWYVSTDGGATYSLLVGETDDTLNYTISSASDVYLYALASSPGCVNSGSDTIVTSVIINDNVCEAFPLQVGMNGPYSTQGCTVEAGEMAPPGIDCIAQMSWCNSTLDATMWFTLVAPPSGRVSIHAPDFDAQLALWKASQCTDLLAGTAQLIAANDDDTSYVANGGVQYSPMITGTGYCLTPGETYYVQLDAYSGYGTTAIIVTDLGAPASPVVTLADTAFCGSVTLDAGNAGPGMTYQWSNGDTTQTSTYTATGMVSVTVTDTLNCRATDSLMVTNNVPVASFTSTQTSLGMFDFTNTSSPEVGTTTYSWTFGDGGTSAVENPSHIYVSNGVYIVTLIFGNECGTDAVTQTVVVNGIGINEVGNDPTVNIFPNPATDVLFVTSGANISQVDVLNAAGQRVLNLSNVNGNKTQLDLSALGRGMYIVQVQTANGMARTRITVVK